MPRTRAQEVILEILRIADGEWTGKAKLFKAFYFAHLYYANENPGLLTDWPIARMPQGPGIDRSDELFSCLVRDGYLTIERIHEGPYPEDRYRLTDKGRDAERPREDARAAIKEATLFCLPRTAVELSLITHERSRSWIEGKDGEILNIYIDTIPDEEYERRAQGSTRWTSNWRPFWEAHRHEAPGQSVPERCRSGVPGETVLVPELHGRLGPGSDSR